MSEIQRSNEGTIKANPEIQRAAHERLRQLQPNGERQHNRHEATEAAREQIKKAEHVRPKAEAAPTSEPVHQEILTKASNYRHTMISLRHRMKPGAKAFSSFIHAPSVEAVSEVAGKTVLRPSVSLGATTTAVLFTGFMYFFARYYGYTFHGSEVWISLILGGIIGLVLEGAIKALRRRP